jgi:hypothetical protein
MYASINPGVISHVRFSGEAGVTNFDMRKKPTRFISTSSLHRYSFKFGRRIMTTSQGVIDYVDAWRVNAGIEESVVLNETHACPGHPELACSGMTK